MSDYNADPNPELGKFRRVAFEYGLVHQDNLKVDQFSTDTSEKVYHFCRRIGSTRVAYLVDPSAIIPA